MNWQSLQRADIPLPGGDENLSDNAVSGTWTKCVRLFLMEKPHSRWGDDAGHQLSDRFEAVYNASGLQWYRHADGLGSAALTTNTSGGVLSSTQYTPYGFDATGSGAGYRSFTGQKQDIDSRHSGGQYDFLMREYNPIQGRWWTPDPAGVAAVDPHNPQTWNRYAYVGGTPLESIDPLGLKSPIGIGDPTVTCSVISGAVYSTDGEDVWEGIYPTDWMCVDRSGSGSSGGSGGSNSSARKNPSLLSRLKGLACSSLPQGAAVSLNGSLGGIGGQNGSLSVVFNYTSGQVSAFATGGLQLGWNGGAQGSISGGLIYGPLGPDNSGFSGRFYGFSGSLTVPGAFVSRGGGVTVVGASAGNNLALSPTLDITATQTSRALQFGPVLGGIIGALMTDPVVLDLRLLLCN